MAGPGPDKGLTFTDVLFRGGWKQRKKSLLTFALIVVVGALGLFGTQFLLRSADQSVTAAQGVEYSGDGFRVLFPGEPTVKKQPVPGTSASATLATWTNKQKAYQVSEVPAAGSAGTVQTMLQGSLSASGSSLIESHPVSIAGGTALAAHIMLGSADAWTVMVLPDDHSHAVTILQTGDHRDDAFFDSLQLR